MGSDFKSGIITFDKPKGIYYSGQTIAGNLLLQLSQPLTFSALNISYHGEAKVSWKEYDTEEYNGQRRTREVIYKGRQDYFHFTQTLAGGNGVTQLPPGSHSLPFQFQIPTIAPSSFDGEKGKVTYYVVAFAEEYPAPITRDEIVKEFQVVAPLDLNMANPAVREPTVLELEEMYSCWCSSNPVSVKVRLPVTGYCPGQIIPAEVMVNNRSSFEIKKMVFQLVQKVRYHSQQPNSQFTCPEEVLVTKKSGPILSNTEKHLVCRIAVPDMMAANLENCSIIDVGYFFRVTVKMNGCNDNMQDDCEICLGLVPIHSTLNGPYTHPMADVLPEGPIPDQNQPVAPQPQNYRSNDNVVDFTPKRPNRDPNEPTAPVYRPYIPNYPPSDTTHPTAPPPAYSETVGPTTNTYPNIGFNIPNNS